MRKFSAENNVNVNFNGDTAMFHEPIYQQIGLLSAIVISSLSQIEFCHYKLLIETLGEAAEDAYSFFEDIKSENAKSEAITKNLKNKLNSKQFEIYNIILKEIKAVARIRNALCHCIWGKEKSNPNDLALMEIKSLLKVSSGTTRAKAKDNLKHEEVVAFQKRMNEGTLLISEQELRDAIDKSVNIQHALVNLSIYISESSQKNECEKGFKFNVITKDIEISQ